MVAEILIWLVARCARFRRGGGEHSTVSDERRHVGFGFLRHHLLRSATTCTRNVEVANVKMYKCRNVELVRFGDCEMWKCRNVEMHNFRM